MVFQWGWGKGLIGLESTVPIVSFIPMFMFAILFGLSMDYEVFLLSRVREEYLVTGDNDSSVIHGIASTARVITSAALIMISVFLGLRARRRPGHQDDGPRSRHRDLRRRHHRPHGLVPATMKLMGDANWWIPTGSTGSCPRSTSKAKLGSRHPKWNTSHPPANRAMNSSSDRPHGATRDRPHRLTAHHNRT